MMGYVVCLKCGKQLPIREGIPVYLEVLRERWAIVSIREIDYGEKFFLCTSCTVKLRNFVERC